MQEREQLQSEVNVACIGLERECSVLRQEITSTMQSNRDLQAQLEAEKQRTEPLQSFARETQRLNAELDRVQAERQRAEDQVRTANEEAARMQRMYADEVERNKQARTRQLREVEESYSEAVTTTQLRLAEMREREHKTSLRERELVAEVQDLVSEAHSARSHTTFLEKTLEKTRAELSEVKERSHHQILTLTSKVEESEAEIERQAGERAVRKREVQALLEGRDRVEQGLRREVKDGNELALRLRTELRDLQEHSKSATTQLQEARDSSGVLVDQVKEARRNNTAMIAKLQVQQVVTATPFRV